MSKPFIPETFLRKNKYWNKPQMSFKRGGTFCNMWADLTPEEREQWNRSIGHTSYSGFIGAYWLFYDISVLMTMVWMKQEGEISVDEFESIMPQSWWNVVISVS